MTVKELISNIASVDAAAIERAQVKWNRVAKPLGSLGKLEALLIQIAGITGSEQIDLSKKAVVSFCADNGVVEEGVTQCGQEVTTSVAVSMARGTSSVCRMASVVGAQVYPVDIGMKYPAEIPNLRNCSVGRGTMNFTKGPAMSREAAERAILIGAQFAFEMNTQGYRLLAAGEMGIGNTTTSSAIVSVLLNLPVEQVTGRGAGLSTEGLTRKVNAIKRGIAVNSPDPNDPLDVLAKLGGFDLAGMVGFYLGCAAANIPVILDGFISHAAALVAVRMCPNLSGYLLPSHVSDEPASSVVLDALGLRPCITANMRLGEGTGAVALMPLLDMALAVYQAPTFDELEIEAYTPQS